jgi:hypothetical protein
VKRGTTAGRGGGGVDSASTTTIQSSNGNLIVTGSDLGPTVFFNRFLVSTGYSRY